MSGRAILVVVILGIICFVDHDWVFSEASEASEASTVIETYVPTYTSDLFWSMCTFATPVQPCIARCGLGGMSKARSAYGRYKFVGHLSSLSAHSFSL